ncbi:MAG: right-handed parallel beta-helix repeat-containing protein [Sedimentisphaerales bacterium]|nr:right-handed parallel beta-helix repeat-containing protein [Sedimentisphaerales bacterium]
MRGLTLVLLPMVLAAPLDAVTLTVDDDGPADFNDIRSAIAAAVSGDTILVADGLYRGPDNRNIEFVGKTITLASANGPQRCIIDCEGKDRGFYVRQSEGRSTVIEGFTVMRGRNSYGGGIYCTSGASPTIRNCILRDNYATYSGGGIACEYQTSPLIEKCIIYSNRSDSQGGGISCSQSNSTIVGCTIAQNTSESGAGLYGYYADLQITNCTFEGNSANYRGGAYYCYRSSPRVTNCVFNDNYGRNYGGAVYFSSQGTPVFANCTFNANTSGDRGAGLYCTTSSMNVTLTHCVLANHPQHAIYSYWGTGSAIRYCLFSKNLPGDYYDMRTGNTLNGPGQINGLSELNVGNVTGNPRFAFEGDMHLTAGSACIDAGALEAEELLPQTDPDDHPRPLDGNADGLATVDIGAFEYDPEQSAVALSSAALEFVQEIDGPAPAPATFEILNSGAVLDWEIDYDSPWLTVEPTAGSTAGQSSEVTVTAHPEGLDQGIHQALLTVRDASSTGRPRIILVSLRVKGTLYVPGQYETIQEAVEAAMEGETVEVGPGTYQESLYLRRPVKLVGIDRPRLEPPSSIGVALGAGDSTVQGFDIVGQAIGIHVAMSNNTIRDNLISGGDTGIQLDSSASNNVLTDNEIVGCATTGLYLYRSVGNTFRDNRLHDSPCNFRIVGSEPADYVNDIDTSNTVDGRAIYYLMDRSNVIIGPAETAGCVVAVDCTNVTVSGQAFRHNAYGVLFVGTDRSRVEGCTVSDNVDGGIVLQQSTDNTLMNNTVSGCGYGIRLDRSGNCLLRGNLMTDNTYNFACTGGTETDFTQDVASSNRVDDKPIYYLVGLSQVAIDRSSNAGCVFAVQCSQVTVRDLVFERNGTGVTFAYTDNSTIENIIAVGNETAGIYLVSSSGNTIAKCRVSDNADGVYLSGCPDTLLDEDVIAFNQRGVWASSGALTMANCLVRGNSPGGGVVMDYGVQGRILNCTIYGNGGAQDVYPEPAGIFCGSSSPVTVANSIVWANYPAQIGGYTTASVSYCDVQGGVGGQGGIAIPPAIGGRGGGLAADASDSQGNIDAPPMLTPDGHLRLGSPCIRAGHATRDMYSNHDVDGETRSGRHGVDIGLDQYNDADSDGLPDWWERDYFNDRTVAAPDGDADGDAYTNITEYEVYSSPPTVPATSFYVDAEQPDDTGDGLSWESAKKTIQAAIDLSGHSDKVYVAPGLYQQNVTTGGRLILLSGLDAFDPDVVAGTIVSGSLTIGNGEMPGCAVAGLTITNKGGAGLICSGAAPTIRNCTITNCFNTQYQQAGGVTLQNAAPTLVQCTIGGNIASNAGGGVLCRSSAPTLRQCVLAGNVAQYGYGGDATAIYAEDSTLTLECCTLADNTNPYQNSTSGSVIAALRSDLSITNSILWNKVTVQIKTDQSSIALTYSDVQGGRDAIQGLVRYVGNIVVDPCFVAPGSWDSSPSYNMTSRWADGDYHLRSAGWRWVPQMTHGTHWVWDGRTSRCIDAGNPADALGEEPVAVSSDPSGEWGRNVRINMGAYGGTREASMAPHDWALRADINNDGLVSLPDWPYVGETFRSHVPRQPADLTRDGRVDYEDVTLMADQWLRNTTWCPFRNTR